MTAETLQKLRSIYASGATADPRRRVERLKYIRKFIARRRDDFARALCRDLGKCETEAMMSEIMPVLQTLSLLIKKTRKWARQRRRPAAAVNIPSSCRIVPEPYGTVLAVSAWNYPLLLAVEPFAGAVAAGNCTVLRPAPAAPATAALLREMVAECVPETACCTDMPPEELAGMGFDYIFFTGGGAVGSKVAAAAGANLTPVTLELGGKSPCIVSRKCNMEVTAKKIVWGKFLNCGQTCVAPDYVLAEEAAADELIENLKRCITEFYGTDPSASKDYPRIVNDFHFARLQGLLRHGKIAAGGICKAEERYIAPTLITEPRLDSPLMEYEIFGPILPIIKVRDLEEAAAIVNARPKPLALYIFTKSKKEADRIIRCTSSGSAAVNDTVMQIMNPSLPFGGVGASGCGAYHGKLTFDTFTHYKAVMHAPAGVDLPVRYPPFARWQQKLVRLLTR